MCQGTGVFAGLKKLNITHFVRCCLMKILAFFHTGAVYFCQTLAGLLNITKWYLQVCNAPTDQVQRFYVSIQLYFTYIFFIIYNQKEKLMTNSHLPIMRHATAHWMSSHFISTQFIAQGSGSDNTAQKTEYPVTVYETFQQIKVCKPHKLISWFYQKLLPNSQPNTATEVWVLSFAVPALRKNLCVPYCNKSPSLFKYQP